MWRLPNSGLGTDEPSLPMDIEDNKKKKVINWSKTRARFKNLESQTLKSDLKDIFNDDTDDDDADHAEKDNNKNAKK